MTARSLVVAGAPNDGVAARIIRELVDEAAATWDWQVGRSLSSRAAAALSLRLGGNSIGRRALASLAPPAHDVFAVCLGPHGLRYAAPALLAARGRRTAFVVDAWPSTWPALVSLARDLRLDVVAVSARDAVLPLATLDPEREYLWVPEGLPASRLAEVEPRPFDVLEIGRRWDRYHDAITAVLEQAGRSHFYQRDNEPPVAPRDEDLLALLSGATVSICFPRSTTHPDVAGDLSTMTLRYLESMAHGCIVIGEGPAEMSELFGWDAVIAVDHADLGRQLLAVLDDASTHSDLLERNRGAVRAAHRWRDRLELLASRVHS